MHRSDNGEQSTEHGDEKSLTTSEAAPADLRMKASDQTPTKKNISTKLDQAAAKECMEKEKDHPVQVVTLKDKELGTFERKTVWAGKWGLVIAFLSLFAASTAAYFVFQQFKEMATQTDLLNRGARQARADSAASNASSAKQLAILQGQLTQQQESMRLDQRAWLGVKEITLSHPLAVGSDIDFGVNTFNTGKTPALHVVLTRIGIGYEEDHPTANATNTDVSVVAPNSNEVFYGSYKYPTDKAIKALISGTAKMYVHGQIDYRDIFKQSHSTFFCAYYPTGGASLNFYNCQNGNSMK